MENNLTDREFWKNYWRNYHYTPIPQKVFFEEFIPQMETGSECIEIGGFPGTMSLFFHKNYKYDVSLLDFFIDDEIISKIEETNGVAKGTIHCIEHDFFTYQSEKTYDLVFSVGFIEHFEATKDVVKRHADLLRDNGQLLIILPNFRGINGWVQKHFDKSNYDAHNINSMDITFLQQIAKELNLSDIYVNYIGRPMVWLEPKPGKWNSVKRIIIKGFSYLIKVLPFKNKFLSPYIILKAKRI